MIDLRITGCCEECQHIVLRLDHYYAGPQPVYLIRCEHEDVCGKLANEEARKYEGYGPETG